MEVSHENFSHHSHSRVDDNCGVCIGRETTCTTTSSRSCLSSLGSGTVDSIRFCTKENASLLAIGRECPAGTLEQGEQSEEADVTLAQLVELTCANQACQEFTANRAVIFLAHLAY